MHKDIFIYYRTHSIFIPKSVMILNVQVRILNLNDISLPKFQLFN